MSTAVLERPEPVALTEAESKLAKESGPAMVRFEDSGEGFASDHLLCEFGVESATIRLRRRDEKTSPVCGRCPMVQ